MCTKLTKAILILALAGLLLPTTGCKHRYGDHDYTDVSVGFDWLDSSGGYFSDYAPPVYYEEEVAFEDVEYQEEVITTSYSDTGYWDDGYSGDCPDCWWKKKTPDRKP